MLAGAAVVALLAVPVRAAPASPQELRTPGFVEDTACAECHRAEFEAWSTSHHAKAMQPATASTVLGDFGGARFTHRGVTSRFFRRGDGFFVRTEGSDGRRSDFPVRYTFGVAPLQQYLVEFPGGRLQSLTIAWDTERKRWFSLYPDRRIPPGSPFHWTGRYQSWNLMCAECHSTNLRKGYDAATDTYRTVWDAMNVGCQACHGPGETHVAWARRSPRGEASTATDRGLLVDLARADARGEADACGRCHARRTRLGEAEQPGRPFLDDFRPEALRAGLYHPDGQQLDEVYEYASFLQSRKAQAGVRCSACHDPHAAAPRARGDALCTGCHGPNAGSPFPTLRAKTYDSPTHHFHPQASAGARCVACHMPERRYMVVHARPDHAFVVPGPDRAARLGTPDPCTTCHAGRRAEWAARTMRQWYGPRRETPTAADVIAAGRTGARSAEPGLIALAADARASAMVRATALDLLRRSTAASRAVVLAGARDPDPLLRAAAVAAVDGWPPGDRATVAAPLLTDPVRAVRLEAARVLAGVAAPPLDRPQAQALAGAIVELRAALRAMADMPASRVTLGRLEARLGRAAAAERAYADALRMDPNLVVARTDLAALYTTTGRPRDAEAVLRDGIGRTPRQGELHYALGLLLVEEGRLADGARELRTASERLSDRARVHYNHGLALDRLGRRRDAERALLAADRRDGADPEIAYALAAHYARAGDSRRALRWAERLVELAPSDRGARALRERIKASLGR